MSSFYCEHCGALCSDTPRGYVTGCEHYPVDVEQCPICGTELTRTGCCPRGHGCDMRE
ncbi:MAG: hypothetical protein WC910_09880 [Bacteroidales bacterium]|jgi:hypothetical protein